MVSTYEIHTETRPERHVAGACATLSVPEIGPWLGKHYTAIAEWLAAHGIQPEGTVYARYRDRDDGPGRFDTDAGFVVAQPVTTDETVEAITLPGGTMAVTTHVGPYDRVGEAYRALEAWLGEQGAELAEAPWEEYVDGPEVDEAQRRTIVVMPYRPA